MEPSGIDREDGAGGACERMRQYEKCQIAFGGSVFGCVLMEASPAAVRVYLPGVVDVPKLVTLRLPSGESRPMRCRWQTGPHVGLEVVGPASRLALG